MQDQLGNRRWTKDESERLKQLYGSTSVEELTKLFPGRTPQSLRMKIFMFRDHKKPTKKREYGWHDRDFR